MCVGHVDLVQAYLYKICIPSILRDANIIVALLLVLDKCSPYRACASKLSALFLSVVRRRALDIICQLRVWSCAISENGVRYFEERTNRPAINSPDGSAV